MALTTLNTKPPKWKSTEMVVCWNPGVDTKLERAVKASARLRGDDTYVVRHAADFVADGDQVPDVRTVVAAQEPPPEPEPTGEVKVRVIGQHQTVIYKGKQYLFFEDKSGDNFKCDRATADRWVDEGMVEILKEVK